MKKIKKNNNAKIEKRWHPLHNRGKNGSHDIKAVAEGIMLI